MKYSLLIPTRDGDKYVKSLVYAILLENYSNFEVIVSFNNSDNKIPNWVHQINDSRFKYINQSNSISMGKNYESLLLKASGDWISLIGDDDGISPGIFEFLDNKIEKYQECNIHFFSRGYFFWPDLHKNGKSKIRKIYSKKSSVLEYSEVIKKIVSGELNHFDLPQCYTNTVFSRDVLKQWLNSHDYVNLFREDNPDIYSSVVFSRLPNVKVRKYQDSPYWVGTSEKSIGFAKKPEVKVIGVKAKDFIDLNLRDNINISNKIDRRIWLKGSNLVFLFSAIDRLPSILKRKEDSKYLAMGLIENLARSLIPWKKIEGHYLNINYTLFSYQELIKIDNSKIKILVLYKLISIIKSYLKLIVFKIYQVFLLILFKEIKIIYRNTKKIKTSHDLYLFEIMRKNKKIN